jgi:hypothetical protein
MVKALTYVIAAQFQALALLLLGWWVGKELNSNFPASFDWLLVTILFAVVASLQTFYVLIRAAYRESKSEKS